MVASDLIGALRDGSKLVSNRDDDSYDRLSNRWSIGLLFTCALLITSYSYVGDPIDCYEPQEFEDQWIAYMDNICWVSNTYYVAMNESIPGPGEPIKQELQYYQWVPIILTLQAIMFMIPGMFWNAAAEGSGYGVKDIVKICRDTDSINPEKRDESIAYLISNMIRFMNYRQPYKNRKMPMGKRYGKYVFIVYMITKLLYLANCLIQLFLLNAILGDGYHIFGYTAIVDMLYGTSWQWSPMFPRVTMCSFEIRRLGDNVHRYTVQCLLPVNLFNEKVYMILWWWLVFVAFMTALGMVLWLLTATSPGSQKAYVQKYLKIMGRFSRPEELKDFTSNFLRLDGVFTLRLIAKNTNDAIAGEVVATLWDKYIETSNAHLMRGEAETVA